MNKDIQESIRRAREAQKGWVDHMKSEGWHRCPVCGNVPVPKGQKICAMCESTLKRRGRLKKIEPEKKPAQTQQKLDFSQAAQTKERDPENVLQIAEYRKKQRCGNE
jgi:hypothetical protein